MVHGPGHHLGFTGAAETVAYDACPTGSLGMLGSRIAFRLQTRRSNLARLEVADNKNRDISSS